MKVKLEQMKKNRKEIITMYPLIGVVIFFALATIFIPYVGIGKEKEDFVNFFLPQLSTMFIPVFFCTYILLVKYREGVVSKAGVGFILGIVFSIAFFIPRTFGYTQLSYGWINIFYTFVPFSLAIIVYYAFDRGRVLKEKQQLEKQNLHNQLAILKNQINPHFLFNTLNNIDSLIRSDKDKASDSLIHLSGMMRYMLYETNVEKVPLKKELKYLEDYLALQKTHFNNEELFLYEVNGNPDSIFVAPLIFITFMENAFKHCTGKNTKHAIRFVFNISEGRVSFESINISDNMKVIKKDISSGAGLDIVKKRLNLIYPDKHKLQIEDENGLHKVKLDIICVLERL